MPNEQFQVRLPENIGNKIHAYRKQADVAKSEAVRHYIELSLRAEQSGMAERITYGLAFLTLFAFTINYFLYLTFGSIR